jgi:arginine repressor
MKPNTTAIERAFEIAKSGRFTTTSDLKRALSAEGYSTEQITGSTLMRQLRALMAAPDATDATP